MQWQVALDSNLELYTIVQSGDATRLKKFEFEGGLFNPKHANGLICFQDRDDERLGLYNPTTEKLIALPECESDFDFGYIHSTNEYKVLAWQVFDGFPCEFQILTLGKDNNWKKVDNVFGFKSLPDHPSVNMGGFLYWFDKHEKLLISFNLVTEKFKILGLPKILDVKEYAYSIFEYEGDLCFVERHDPRTGRCSLDIVNLWMLKDGVGSNWVLMLKDVVMPLDGTELWDYYIDDIDACSCSVVCGGGGEVMVLGADINNAWIFAWNFLNGELRRIRVGDEQIYLNMALVRKHVENDIDLKQFRPRRKRNVAVSAASVSGMHVG